MVNEHKVRDFFSIAWKSMGKRQTRSWLTMVGIFIGIAAVVALISLGQGLEDAINAEFEELGMDKIFVAPGGSLFGMGGTDALSNDDVELIRNVKDVESATSYMLTTAQVSWDDEVWWHMVIGVKPEKEDTDLLSEIYRLEFGRWFKQGEKNKAIVGYDYANHPVFEERLLIGDKIVINGEEFEVIGSLEKVGNSNDDRTIIIPMDTAREIFDIPVRVDSIFVKVKKGVDTDIVAQRIEDEMRKDRNLKEGDEDFTVQTFKEVIEGFLSILDIVMTVLIGIAAISLIIGGIGIMNTMYTAVLERTKEIGIMKAIGAKNSDVMWIFLIESGMLGIAGGIIGILLGAGLAAIAAFLAQTVGGFEYLKASFPLWLILGSLAFSFFVGVLSGILPARQAAKKNPVDSLRYE